MPGLADHLRPAWNSRSLADELIVRLILDGTVVRVRLDRKATSKGLRAVGPLVEDTEDLTVRKLHDAWMAHVLERPGPA